MRILYLSPCAQLGGAERCLLDLFQSLRRSEPDWSLHLISGVDGPLLEEARSLGVYSQALPFPSRLALAGSFGTSVPRLVRSLPATASYGRQLRREIRRIHPDAVHTNGFKMHLLAAWVSPAPVFWHLHDYLSPRPFAARVLRASSHGVQGAIAVSQSVASDARRVLGETVPIETVPNAVDLERFHPRGPVLHLHADPEVICVGLVATFARWKGHDVVLRALASPELRSLPIQGYVIGGPIYETANSQYSLEELRAIARSLHIEDRVSFTGFRRDTPAIMRSLDIVLHASTHPEPFGLAIAEAMACGRPVIVSDAGGACELFLDGRDAIGSPPGDAQALAQAIARLALDPALRARLGVAARQTAEVKFNRERLGPTVSSFYRRILTGTSCESSTSTAAISTAA